MIETLFPDIQDRDDVSKYPLSRKIEYSINLLKRGEKLALQLDHENGYWLAFSGGKDSQALYHIAKLAGVKFKGFFSLTTIDPPEVIKFVKKQYPDIELIKPAMSIYEMAKRKKILPTRICRWCCAEYKEKVSVGKVVLIGIRNQESVKRSKRKEFSISRKEMYFDEFEQHEETTQICVGGKDKILVSPIIHWSEKDVWEFLSMQNVPHCKLYDEGQRRIGCICCPMKSKKQKLSDLERYPHVKRNWIKIYQYFIDTGVFDNETSAEERFEWWISGVSWKQFKADKNAFKMNF